MGISLVATIAFVSSFGYVMVRDSTTVDDLVTDFTASSVVGQSSTQVRWSVTNATLATLSVMGPTGGTGPNGTIGPNGTRGATGPQGGVGPVGATGPTGQNTSLLVTGPTGLVGPTGNAGVIGPVGPTGPQGSAGPIGPNGTNTVTGPTGWKGNDTTPAADLVQPPSALASTINELKQAGIAADPWGIDTEWIPLVDNKLYYIPLTIDHTTSITGLSFVYRERVRDVSLVSDCRTSGTNAFSIVVALLLDEPDGLTREYTFPGGQVGNVSMPRQPMPYRPLRVVYTNAVGNTPASSWRSTSTNQTTTLFEHGHIRRLNVYPPALITTLAPGRYFVVVGIRQRCSTEVQFRAARYSSGGLGYDILSTPGTVKPVLGYMSDLIQYNLVLNETYPDEGGIIREFSIQTNTLNLEDLSVGAATTSPILDWRGVNTSPVEPSINIFNLVDVCFGFLAGQYYDEFPPDTIPQPCFTGVDSPNNRACEMCRTNSFPRANFTAIYDRIPLITLD